MDSEQLSRIIKEGMDTSHVSVSGDGRHFQAVVVSDAFIGRSMIKQHQAVYATLGDHFDTATVHALQLRTYTVAQWQAIKD